MLLRKIAFEYGDCVVGALRNARKHVQNMAKFAALRFVGLAGEQERHAVGRNRLILAARFIRGEGIEIGGLGRVLPAPRGARVKYLDRFDRHGLYSNFPKMRGTKIVEPDIVDDGETLSTVAAESQDFLIANHVVEHFQNPILFFQNASRVLKKGGVLFLALPEKTRTFDRDRPLTTFEHLLRDLREGPEQSRIGHFREFARLADTHNGAQAWRSEAEYEALVQKLIAEDYSIHFHVWDCSTMIEMVLRLKRECSLPFEPKAMLSSGDEVVFILEKV